MSLPDGGNAAWYDRKTGEIHVFMEDHRDAVLDVLAPYLTGTSAPTKADAPPGAQPGSPPPPPEDDLALNRPGDAVRARANELAPSRVRYALGKLVGRQSEADSWMKGLKGEKTIGGELERLTRRGWRVLHSIPLPGEVDIDHLLLGPGGVFSINTKRHPGAQVWVGDESVKIGNKPYPYVRKSRHEARRAAKALTRACGFEVVVHPVLAFVGTAKVTVVPSLDDVRVLRDREFAALGPMTGVLHPSTLDAIYAMARSRRTWLSA
ncbi:nuclease-related domain-containing protein [Streptomyces sp. NPDC051776]|uniref:nuclease-related domain-containing protein n=1 Tax=Streptomyces sp. NPDC051776 TaxID=3155414 RepID=UPI003447767F